MGRSYCARLYSEQEQNLVADEVLTGAVTIYDRYSPLERRRIFGPLGRFLTVVGRRQRNLRHSSSMADFRRERVEAHSLFLEY